MIFEKVKIKVFFVFMFERFIEMFFFYLILIRYERILYKVFVRIDVYLMSYYKILVKFREVDIYFFKKYIRNI